MKLVVCGCSFSAKSPKPDFIRTHWSEILAEKLNAKLINLAVGGATNNFIRLQLETAKDLKPDFIIINATTPNRLELRNLEYKKSIFAKKIKNYSYKNCYWNSFTGKGNLIGLPITTILDKKTNIPITEKQVRIVDDYLNDIYDEVWKTQLDRYVLTSGIYELYYNNYNFLFNQYLLDSDFVIDKNIKEKHFVEDDLDFNLIEERFRIARDKDPGYHTAPEGQQVIAEKYYTAITNYIEKYNVNIGK